MSELSRRSLLKTGAAVLSAFGVSQAMATPTKLGQRKWDLTYDVVVVGAGGAGLAAGVEAIDQKLKTIILEKEPIVGGSSTLCGGMIAVAGTDEQAKAGIKDSKELFIKDMMKMGGGFNDEAVVRAYVDADLVHYNWLSKTMGLKPDQVVAQGGQTVPRSHHYKPSDVIQLMNKYVKEHGVKVQTRAKVERLVWNESTTRIVGVRAKIKGKTVFIQAKKGVLLAAGGFSRNPNLIAKYNPSLIKADAISGLGTQGDGILMGLAAGADMLDTAYIKATYGFKPHPSTIDELSLIFYSGGIIVDANAKRFVDESISYKKIADVALPQTNGKTFIVFDQNILAYDVEKNPQGRELWLPVFKDGKKPDYVYIGATLKEAAQKAGLNPEALEDTVKVYNEGVAKKNDALGRKHLVGNYGDCVKIEKGPFYVFPATGALIATYCGLKITPQAKVVDVFGDVIPGLWAAGEMTGGVHGASYMSGTAFSKGQAFGRIAVRDMAK